MIRIETQRVNGFQTMFTVVFNRYKFLGVETPSFELVGDGGVQIIEEGESPRRVKMSAK